MTTQDPGPHAPSPGYKRRWIKIAFSILLNTPEAFLVLALGLLPGALIVAAVVAGLTHLGVSGAEPLWIVTSMLAPLAGFPALLGAYKIMIERETQVTIAFRDILDTCRAGWLVIAMYNTLYVVLSLAWIRISNDIPHFPTPDFSTPQDTLTTLARESLYAGTHGIMGYAMFLALFAPAALWGRMTLSRVVIFKARTYRKLFFVEVEIFLILLLVCGPAETLGPAGYALLFFAAAFSNAAAREIAGGMTGPPTFPARQKQPHLSARTA